MKMNTREQAFVSMGVIVLLGLAIYFLIIEPVQKQESRYRSQTRAIQNELAEMRTLAAQYKSLAERQEQLEKQVQERGNDFAPFSYLENVARDTGLIGQIESMTPVASAMEDGRSSLSQFDVRLKGIGLRALVRFLHKIESSEKVFFVENLNIRPRYLTPEVLDVTLRLSTPVTT